MTIPTVAGNALSAASWANAVAAAINGSFAYGTYTPTLTGMVIGTGGSPFNQAEYQWVGGALVGDEGMLSIRGHIVFGTSGQTFPTAPTFSLPSGFQFVTTGLTDHTQIPIGWTYMTDSSTAANNRMGSVTPNSATTVRPFQSGWSAARATLTTTTPFTWASGDGIEWSILAAPAVRV